MRRTALLLLAAVACGAAARREAEPGSIPWFAAKEPKNLADFVLGCRDDSRLHRKSTDSEEWCLNAEAAMSRQYAAALRSERFARLRSPSWWVENHSMVAAVRPLCLNPHLPDPADYRVYCRYIPSRLLDGKST